MLEDTHYASTFVGRERLKVFQFSLGLTQLAVLFGCETPFGEAWNTGQDRIWAELLASFPECGTRFRACGFVGPRWITSVPVCFCTETLHLLQVPLRSVLSDRSCAFSVAFCGRKVSIGQSSKNRCACRLPFACKVQASGRDAGRSASDLFSRPWRVSLIRPGGAPGTLRRRSPPGAGVIPSASIGRWCSFMRIYNWTSSKWLKLGCCFLWFPATEKGIFPPETSRPYLRYIQDTSVRPTSSWWLWIASPSSCSHERVLASSDLDNTCWCDR